METDCLSMAFYSADIFLNILLAPVTLSQLSTCSIIKSSSDRNTAVVIRVDS